ncbi:alpha-amylase family protein [Microlunatus ginsengisoli]|uniref:Alpha-amylase family protein n=1 Tax=Microlunatus ginsengisoli TaxID=363863 RepID=A0ABP7ALT4_9ACTN
MSEPDWIAHAVFWQVYPLGFVGAEPARLPAGADPRHRLDAITERLSYTIELGANGVLLGPIFESETHGYDTVDYFAVDRRLGTAEDLADLIRAAHDRGLRVLLDGVFNHVGRGFDRFAATVAHGPGAPEEDWFRVRWGAGAEPGDVPAYDDFEGHEQLVALNHDSPAVIDFVTEVMCHWLEAGVDGWRLDAAYAVPLPFWAEVSRRVRERFPDAYLVGEVIHGDYRSFVTDGGLDSVTQYELWKAVRSSIAERNLFELAHALGRHDEFLDTFVPLTFVGNHDVTRIASAVPAEHLPHALAVLCCVGGTPTIYYGDELGWEGVKEERFGGDDAIRTTFPTADIAADPRQAAVLDLHRDLIGVRRRHPWLHRASTTVPHLANEHAVLVSAHDKHWLALALNLSDQEQTMPVPGDGTVTVAPHGWAIVDSDG